MLCNAFYMKEVILRWWKSLQGGPVICGDWRPRRVRHIPLSQSDNLSTAETGLPDSCSWFQMPCMRITHRNTLQTVFRKLMTPNEHKVETIQLFLAALVSHWLSGCPKGEPKPCCSPPRGGSETEPKPKSSSSYRDRAPRYTFPTCHPHHR